MMERIRLDVVAEIKRLRKMQDDCGVVINYLERRRIEIVENYEAGPPPSRAKYSRLTNLQRMDVLRKLNVGRKGSDLAKEFNTTTSTIWYIKHRWRRTMEPPDG